MLKEELQIEIKRLNNLLKQVQTNKTNKLESKLRITKINGRVCCYVDGKYVPKTNNLPKEIAQNSYLIKTEKILAKTLQKIISLNDFLNKHNIEDCYEKLSSIRKTFVKPLVVGNETYALQWKIKKYTPKGFKEGDICYETLNKERVRSKSEKIIADTLRANNIPYRYEYPYQLKTGEFIYPDFTVLNKRTRKEVIIEHFGLLDNSEYFANSFVRKIKSYQTNGFILGKNFIFTFETKDQPFDTKYLESIIKEFLL